MNLEFNTFTNRHQQAEQTEVATQERDVEREVDESIVR